MNNRHSNILGGRGSDGARPTPRRARGFTLIELMVVLAIMALVTAVTVGAFKSLSENNQRTACQTNLTQIYQGLRLYMADENGQPPLYDPNAAGWNSDATKSKPKNIGLWQLWTYPSKASLDKIAPIGEAPTARYIRSTNFLHCPSDSDAGTLRPNLDLFTDATKTEYNPDFLSYQMYATAADYSDRDSTTATEPESKIDTDAKSQAQFQTYLPERTPPLLNTATAADKEKYKRQLRQVDPSSKKTPPDPLKRQATDNTIVTWCRHHRYVRPYDNVLFFDGSVQLIPRDQDEYKPDSCDTTGTVLKGADRVPRRSDCD